LLTLSDALAALEGRKEFLVNRYDGLVSINYLIVLPDSFEGVRREFRGITFDESSGQVVSLPLHKFFNVNEKPETQWHFLKDLDAEVFEKLDGTMIHFFEWRGKIRAATRMSSSTSQAQNAMELACQLKLLDRIRYEIREGYTPIFEMVSPENQIVLHYKEPRLVYLVSRRRSDGTFFDDGIYSDRARSFDFRFADLMDHLAKEEFEGYVARLSNGLWVKCKCPWYLERHRAVDLLMRPAWKLYEACHRGVMDDLIACAPNRFKGRLRDIAGEANIDFLRERERILALSAKLVAQAGPIPDAREARKRYAILAGAKYSDDFSALMLAFSGRDTDEPLKKKLLEGYKAKYRQRLSSDLDVDSVDDA
jgi:RNA ligase